MNLKLRMKTHKKIFYFLILILFTAIIAGCDKPAPTELIGTSQNEDPIEYETIAKSPTDELYSNGTDTTGVSEINKILQCNYCKRS